MIMSGRGSEAGIDLESAIAVHDDSSSDEELAPKKKARIGSRSTRVAATTQILMAIKKRHLQNDDHLLAQGSGSGEQATKIGLSESTFDSLAMTHNTTVEFLHYFWTVYFSGDPDRANEVGKLVETLDNSLNRIKAVADTAENEHAVRVEQLKRESEAYTKRTGKRRRFDPESVEGGAKVVNKVAGPLVRAIKSAKEQYEKALLEQTADRVPA
jgi:transcription initiation factor TFIIH subunit 1